MLVLTVAREPDLYVRGRFMSADEVVSEDATTDEILVRGEVPVEGMNGQGGRS